MRQRASARPLFYEDKSMAFRIALAAGFVLACTPVLAAEPVRIGVTTILSGQYLTVGKASNMASS